ncbi:MAG TPA: DUF4097 family beta strand repeat-containing protein [Opitutaceae bacterium]|nr:DUF4097 family beta strand repeat-containing protein [Opitutaceae bacterium]
MSKFVRILLIASLASALIGAASARSKKAPVDEDSMNTSVVKLTDPNQPAKLSLNINTGDITVRGSDTAKEVTVRSTLPREDGKPRPDGLRRLDTEVALAVQEKDNKITIDNRGTGPAGMDHVELVVTVPSASSVMIKTGWGGDITVDNVSGVVEISNVNGDVKLNKVSCSTVVDTMNGEIKASFVKLPTDKPVCLSSMNGTIEVYVPSDAKASCRLRTQNGTILTDFDDKALVTKTEPVKVSAPTTMTLPNGKQVSGSYAKPPVPPQAPTASIPGVPDDLAAEIHATVKEATLVAHEAMEQARIAMEDARTSMSEGSSSYHAPRAPRAPKMNSSSIGGKVVVGTLNGGGVDLQLTTMNGTITLRKTTGQ